MNSDDLEELGQHGGDANRSEPLQDTIRGELRPLKRASLAEECAKLDPEVERAEAEQWLSSEIAPLEY